jgi:hypothetical protein
MKRIFKFIFITLLAASCGQQIPPTGGPRDTLPPKLMMALPDYKSTNFKADKIILTFDEYVSLDNPFEKVTFSPIPKYNPIVESKLKNVTIKIKDTLEENTTYHIDFGGSVRDINENNVLKNLTYTFSTGNYIDSAVLGGKVYLAETGKIDSTLIVVLHRNLDDSAVAKEKPRYITKLKGDGSFLFSNLKPGTYNLFAIKDNDGGKKYDQISELIAFLNNPVQIGKDSTATLYAFEEAHPPAPVRRPASSSSTKKDEDKRLRLSNNLDANKQDILTDLILSSFQPFRTFDSSKIQLFDKQFKTVLPIKISRDSTNKKIIIANKWSEGLDYNLVLQKEFATDTLDNKFMKTDTIAFSAKRLSEYGSIKIKIENLDSTLNAVLLLKKDDKIFYQQRLLQKSYSVPLIQPGDYEISILFDRNENGKWDTGNYWKKLQPEKITLRKEVFNIRANWENELTVNLNAIQKRD